MDQGVAFDDGTRRERALPADLTRMQLLLDFGARLVPEGMLQVPYEDVLQAAISLTDADAGMLQILDPATGQLVLVVSRGLDSSLTEHFARIDARSNTSCGRALRAGERTVMHFDDPAAPDPDASLRMHVEAGYRSAQSTPLLSRAGHLIGMLSTHWRTHREPEAADLRFVDLLARQAADLIERRNIEHALRKSEERLRLLVESFAQVVHPDDRAPAIRAWADAVRERRELDAEFRLRTADGQWRWTSVQAAPILDTSGRVRRWAGMNIDVAARKHAVDALQEVERRKDEFLATLAHELRNPLAPLRHGVQIARLTCDRDGPLRSVVEMMDRQLSHLVRLVDDLLDVGRVHAGKVELRRQPVRLADVLLASAESARSALAARRQDLQLEFCEQPVRVLGDFDRLVQVFTNLLSNAVKYSEPGAKIRLQLCVDGEHVLVKVVDHGIGIPASELANVFDLFSQVRALQGRSDGGLGVGLALVRSLVALHQGTVEAKSAGPGTGSTFCVRLPLLAVSTHPGAGHHTAPVHAHAPRRRVLVVDDNVDAGESLAALLRLLGHDVATARDGIEAIAQAEAVEPEVVFMDLGMPRMDGVEAARRLRQLPGGDRTQIVALTGWGQAADRERTRRAGFDLHLVKPIDEKTLVEALGRPSQHAAAHA